MADPALTQIADAMKTVLDDGEGTAFVDRDDAEPILAGERPARVIRIVDVQMNDHNERGTDTVLMAATIDIDHYVDADVTDNISFQHNALIAETVALLGNDQTLGGKVFLLAPQSVTANADDVPDSGVAILTLDVQFLVKAWDWTTIVF